MRFLYKNYCNEVEKWHLANYDKEEEGFFHTGPFRIYGLYFDDIYRGLTFKCIPQYEIQTPEVNYIVDFAFVGSINYDKLKSKKMSFHFFIECDGHEFHSSKEQRGYDNQRTRVLKSLNWEELRYSGSELNSGKVSPGEDFIRLINKKYFDGIEHVTDLAP